jgi:hypothetical protein
VDAYLLLWWLVFALLVILDAVLWGAGFALPLRGETRFRCLSAAAVVTYFVVWMLAGLVPATVLGAVGLWLYAVLVGANEPQAQPLQ